MARRSLLRPSVGEQLLTSKLQILSGTDGRRPSVALGILTGRTQTTPPRGLHRRFSARTVYLSERHLRDVEAIIQAWQPTDSRRWTRSAVLRRAIEHLRAAVEANPPQLTLETD